MYSKKKLNNLQKTSLQKDLELEAPQSQQTFSAEIFASCFVVTPIDFKSISQQSTFTSEIFEILQAKHQNAMALKITLVLQQSVLI